MKEGINPSQIEEYTRELTAIPSVNESWNEEEDKFNESIIAEKIKAVFDSLNIRCILQNLPPETVTIKNESKTGIRKNVFAFIPGKSSKTIILAGHFDTVGTNDFQKLGLRPEEAFDSKAVAQQLQIDTEKYLAGRGSFDMKSGIAAGVSLMNYFNCHRDELDGSILFVGTCDEENNSYGILNASEILLQAKGAITPEEQVRDLVGDQVLDLLGVINMDYTTQRYPADPEYHVWNGTIGKLLPSIYVRGQETHAGEHFAGFHASSLLARITSHIDGNMQLADTNVPPTTLKFTDNRLVYDVMTASSARAYFNFFTTGKTPGEVLSQIETLTKDSLESYLDNISRNYQIYCQRMNLPLEDYGWEKRTRVMKYSDLLTEISMHFGNEETENIIKEAIASCKLEDLREKSFAVIESLLNKLEQKDPTIVIFFSPPFYPYIKPDTDNLAQTVRARSNEVGKQNNIEITMHDFYPYISDMSYLRIEPEIRESLSGLVNEMPLWQRGYSLNLDKVEKLNLPVVNIGPYGFGAHKTGEMVERYYSFNILPGLIIETVNDLLTTHANIK